MEVSTRSSSDNDADEKEGSAEDCGCEVRCWCFRTKRRKAPFLSCLNTPTGALIFLSMVAFMEGMVVNGLYNVSVTTLEKRFGLRSFETGMITSALDAAGCFSSLITSYVGGAGCKPLWIGSGVLIMGFGSAVFSLPHFLIPPYSPVDVESFDCSFPQTCEESTLRPYRGFFFLGFILIGVGATPIYTLAISYLDENVEQVRSSTFNGIFAACSLLGPGAGFLFGGYLLSFFTTMGDPGDITPENPAWVGNWWLSFLLVGIITTLLSIPLLMYPKSIPGTEKHRENRENEIQHSKESMKAKQDAQFGKSVKDVPRSIWILMKNPTVMTISLATAVDSGLLIGIATFGPKYIESLFGLTASDAGIYFGALAIGCASSGNLISGYLITKLELSVPQMLKMCLATSVVAFGCYFVFLRTCPDPEIAGAFVPYPSESDVRCETSTCGCTTELFRPICGSNNLTYLSFCHAGCDVTSEKNFTNCSRIDSSGLTASPVASSGICPSDNCPNIAVYMLLLGLAVFLTFFNFQPVLQCSMRVVLFSQRSFCLGFQWAITRLLGSIPIPIIFGTVLDQSCKVWGKECGQCGSCHVYDNHAMSSRITWLCVVLKAIGLVCIVAAIVTYKPPTSPTQQVDSTRTEETTNV